jgi:hypothetical protein
MIRGSGVPVAEIKRRWGSSNLSFYQNYVTVLLRSSLLELSEEFNDLPLSESCVDLGGYTVEGESVA